MVTVVDPLGNTYTIEDMLLRDFFEGAYLYDKDLLNILSEYNMETRHEISRFIIAKLAEVCPGYLPANT